MIVKTRVFPTGTLVNTNFKQKGEVIFGGQKTPFIITTLETMYYNATNVLYIDIDESKIKHLQVDLLTDSYPSPKYIRLHTLPNGMFVGNFYFDFPSNLELNKIISYSGILFKAIAEFDGLIFDLIESLKSKNLLLAASPIPYDTVGEISKKRFIQEMGWRAWATTNIFSHKPYNINKINSKYNIDTITIQMEELHANIYHWSAPITQNSLFAYSSSILEPMAYIISYRTLVDSANRNIEDITSQYIVSNKLKINSHILRKYINYIQLCIIKTKEFEGSSNKFVRPIYRHIFNRHDINNLISEMDKSNNLAYSTLEAIKQERNEKTNFYLNFVAIVFTGLAFISVIADLIGLVDYKSNILSFKPRLFIAFLSLLFVILLLILTRRKIK